MENRLLPPSAWTSAFVAAAIGFGATVPLVALALHGLGATVAQAASAITALCLAISAASAITSIRLRMPVTFGWSTPGAALLAAAAPTVGWQAIVGAFVAAASMNVVLASVPPLDRLAGRIPKQVSSALLAGVLLPFCLAFFGAAGARPLLVAAVLLVFLAFRHRATRYAIPAAMCAGLVLLVLRGDVAPPPSGVSATGLILTTPILSPAAVVAIGLPLFLVTLASQNLPGVVVLRAAGYDPPARALLLCAGVASLAAAPFGGHAVNLAAVTSAICTSEDAHPSHERRWVVGVIYGGFYGMFGLFSPTLVHLFLAMRPEVLAVLTGVALLPALVTSLEGSLDGGGDRDAAIVTLLATASGFTLFGLGAAFWGLVSGLAATMLARLATRRRSSRSL
ncbi:benzoate/H(+) symporter BenE family transporter [Sphingomonas sp. BK580]|uniref:benzoate/H(+) symporter BenE family transporter n=1 Tax=Sphingomonas sp. BK580 TaxID=2586972 RepID=UPI00161040E8|nr:benzoate/H(+) symporter BenE family transporter [Sphingomonas sp. BK580]MBB3693569.1 benzoate membrane transport protein [Sphingomonas sp. BK580]